MSTITYALLLSACLSMSAGAQTASAPPPSTGAQTASAPSPSTGENPPAKGSRQGATSAPAVRDQAWELLLSGIKEDSAEKRATAVRVLSLLTGEAKAVTLASRALSDSKPQVRVAAAIALGELRAKSAIPELENALSDDEPLVTLAAAHSLLTMKDTRAYAVYYQILIGERRGSKGLMAGQLDTLKDPKKLALLGFQEGLGFVPFAGIGYSAIRTVMKDDSSPVRAAAVKVLADDHDSAIEDAMVEAATDDKNQLVRTAALDALARRGNPAVIARIASAMSDDKDPVKYTAAAAIVHLNDVAERRKRREK